MAARVRVATVFSKAYSVAITTASLVEIPFKRASTISAPVISRQLYWYNYQNLQAYLKIKVGYLFFIALAIAGGIWLCSADLFALMPQKQLLDQAFAALILLVLAKLVDAGMGFSGYVLMLSKYYGYHFGVVLVVLCVHIGLLFTLIPQYGVAGAALPRWSHRCFLTAWYL